MSTPVVDAHFRKFLAHLIHESEVLLVSKVRNLQFFGERPCEAV